MIKKILGVCAIVAAVSVFVLTASAQTTTNSTSSSKQNSGGRQELKKENLQDKLEQRRAKIKEIVASKVDHRFRAMIKNLEQFSGRIESRINKLAGQGVDVSSAREKLSTAKAKIEEAKASLANLEKDILAAAQAQDSRKALAAAKVKISKGVVEKIKLAHRALVESVAALKKGANKIKETRATSTVPAATSSAETN